VLPVGRLDAVVLLLAKAVGAVAMIGDTALLLDRWTAGEGDFWVRSWRDRPWLQQPAE